MYPIPDRLLHKPMSLLLALILSATAAGSYAKEYTKPAPALESVSAASIMDMISRHDGPVLVNVWATWCLPCREEMPDLLKLREQYKDQGFESILVSADFDRHKKAAREFLGSLGVDFKTYIKNQTDQEFIDGLDPDWTGALPVSILFDQNSNVAGTWYGRIVHTDASDRISALLR